METNKRTARAKVTFTIELDIMYDPHSESTLEEMVKDMYSDCEFWDEHLDSAFIVDTNRLKTNIDKI